MTRLRRWYRRLDGWTRSLSRAKYAVVTGVVAFLTYMFVGGLLGEFAVAGAIGVGLALTVVYYLLDPRKR